MACVMRGTWTGLRLMAWIVLLVATLIVCLSVEDDNREK